MSKEIGLMRCARHDIEGIRDLCGYLSNHLDLSKETLLEIGSYSGESTELFLEKFKSVHCVDPWDHTIINDGCFYKDKMHLSEVEKVFDQRLKGRNILKFRVTSDDFFRDNIVKYNVIYIDGLHTYEQVKKDILNAKEHGIKYICGHDFSPHWPEVKKAVVELLGEPDSVFQDYSWIKILNFD